jgi:hypothetical protein
VRPFPARYPGVCGSCDERVAVDDWVVFVDDKLTHADCAERGPAAILDAPPGKVCTSCWTVHAGECL